MVHSCSLEPWWSGRTYFFAKEAGSKALEGSNPSGSAYFKIGGVDEWFKSTVY